MPYLNLDLDYHDHPKTKRLVGLLGRGAEALPIKLWCYCGKYHADDGKLTGYSAQEIESICAWWGQKGEMIEAFVKVNFLHPTEDGFQVHEWKEHQGHLGVFKERASAAAKARWEKYRREEHPNNASSIAPSNASSIAQAEAKHCSLPYQALPDQKNKKKETIPRAPVSEIPVPERKEAPRLSKGTTEQDEAFKAFWDAYPARNGKKLEEQETFRRFCLIPAEDWPNVIQAAQHYAESEQERDGVGIKDPKNFLGNQATERGFWREWIEGGKSPEDDDSVFGFLEKEKRS